MSTRRRLKLLALVINRMTRAAAAKVVHLLENDQMEIYESTFAPGSRTEQHSHAVNEATYVLAGGRMKYTLADGTFRIVELNTGDLRWRAQPETHIAENVGGTTIRMLTVRIKGAAGPS